jgi:hypothetical protein
MKLVAKFAAGVVDTGTGGNFAAGVVYAGVVDTSGQP